MVRRWIEFRRAAAIMAAAMVAASGWGLVLAPAMAADDGATAPAPVRPLVDDDQNANWPRDHVAVELYAGLADGAWELAGIEPYRTYPRRAVAMTAVPRHYDSEGMLAKRPNPHLLRTKTSQHLSAGNYRFLLRSKNAARLFINGRLVLETGFMPRNSSGHEPVPPLQEPRVPGMHPLPANHQEVEGLLELDEGEHRFLVEAIVGGKGLRAELGELVVAYQTPAPPTARQGETPFLTLGPEAERFAFTESQWNAWCLEEIDDLRRLEQAHRFEAAASQQPYWDRRHEWARAVAQDSADFARVTPPGIPREQVIDYWIEKARGDDPRDLPPVLDDYPFLRRLALDVIGIPPSPDDLQRFLDASPETRRAQAVERYLAHPRWADPWVAYWQDVLAENPGILKPELNNTGPFRWWIHESFLDHKPLDRFATELAMMSGSVHEGGPAGFSLATQNDSPMAAKAHVLAQAFLGVEMSCARCHDAPYHPHLQQELFQLAAMLNRQTLKLPESSTVPVLPGGRTPAVEISLQPGDAIEAAWPFDNSDAPLPAWILRDEGDPREEFAARMTSPQNLRFAEVLANRIWQRYLGWGIVASADDWYQNPPSHPELLTWLAYELIASGYDTQHLARLILNSEVYQRQAFSPQSYVKGTPRVAPERRRLTAEQVVDSLFAVNGKPFDSEPLTLDQEGRRPASTFLNLGIPDRAWQLTSLSNERDRPALSLPVAQGIVDVLLTFGWRDARPHPINERDHTPTILQPLVLANGMAVNRIVRLTPDSELTRLSLEEISLAELVRQLYLRILSRPPNSTESARIESLLGDGFEQRRRDGEDLDPGLRRQLRSAVSWSNHLSAEASEIKLELERMAREGEPPTVRLDPDWRQRMEDAVWALVTSPEFIFVP